MNEQEQVKLMNDLAAAVGKFGDLEAKVAAAGTSAEAQIKALATEVDQVKGMLGSRHGPSGANDVLNEMNKFVRGAYWHKRTGKWPEDCKLMQNAHQPIVDKAAATMTTTTDATAGYLVPEYMDPEIAKIMEIHGTLYPLVTKVTCPAGGSLRINADSLLPSAAWQLTQGGAMTEEATPLTFAGDTLIPSLLYIYIKVADELMNFPGVNFGAVAAVRMVSRLMRKLEEGMIQGTASSTAPSDGILVLSGVNDQTNIGGTTLAYQTTYVQEAVADYEGQYITSDNIICTTPAKVLGLMASTVGASELTGALSWGSPREGVPPTLFGYPLLAHPGCLVSTTHWQWSGNPKMITLAESGRIGIDFNPLGAGWTSNQTYMRVISHYDWSLGVADSWSKADYS